MTFPLGGFALSVLAFCISAFAFSTVVCWYFYGTEAFSSLFGKRGILILPIYLAFVIFGSLIPSGVILFFTDALLLILTVITSLLLIKKSDRICTLSEGFGLYGSPKKLFKAQNLGMKFRKRKKR